MKIVRCENQSPTQAAAWPRLATLWGDPFLAFPRAFRDLSLHDSEWSEDSTRYEVRFELPGLKRDEIKLSLENGLLVLKGSKRVRREGAEEAVAIERSVVVPEGVNPEAIEAKYEDGILEVILPKREEVKPKEIVIQVK